MRAMNRHERRAKDSRGRLARNAALAAQDVASSVLGRAMYAAVLDRAQAFDQQMAEELAADPEAFSSDQRVLRLIAEGAGRFQAATTKGGSAKAMIDAAADIVLVAMRVGHKAGTVAYVEE